jgi:GNAT superfamily N-acetyltransferase
MDFAQIRLANMGDVEEIATLFKLVTDQMKANGIEQWHYKYPLASHVSKDIEAKRCHVYILDGQIAGTITVDSNQDEQYKNVHWKYSTDTCYIIHRLGVHPFFQGRGISKTLCYYAEHLALEKDIHYIRLDAYSLNPVSNKLYTSLGYRLADGVCHFHGNEAPFFCYEKKLV